MNGSPNERREPINPSKSLAPISPELPVLMVLKEPQVGPGDEEPELTEDPGHGVDGEHEYVGEEEVDPGEVLRSGSWRVGFRRL